MKGVAVAVALALAGCGGGSSTTSTSGTTASATATNADGETLSTLTTGFELPSEISAVPTADSSSTTRSAGLKSALTKLSRAASALPADSDYQQAQGSRYIEERALEQFDIIEQVLSAVGQTNYADPSVINQGPYKAMVSWTEERDGREVVSLQPWVVDSRMIVENGQDVNRVLVWIEEPDYDNPGQTRTTKAEFKIYTPATLNADGSFADYGDWDLNVSFNDSASDYFVASSRVSNGETTIMLADSFTEVDPSTGSTMTMSTKGIMVRGLDGGYGKVSYPDWDACFGPTGPTGACIPTVPSLEVAYAYNNGWLGVQDPTGVTVYKDRNLAGAVEMVHRYGIFYDENPPAGVDPGDNIEKHLQFGFPIQVPVLDQATGQPVLDPAGNPITDFAFYGAWQGRHEIWGQGSLPAGTVVTRGDHADPNTPAPTYTVADPIRGTFVKRLLADASLADIQGLPVEIWLNDGFQIVFDGTAWQRCDNGWVDLAAAPPQCIDAVSGTAKAFTAFTDFAMLQGDVRKMVFLNGMSDPADPASFGEFIYLSGADAPGGDGFYAATWGTNGLEPASTTPTTFLTGAMIDVNVSGSTYIEYTGDFTTGTGWVEKSLVNFDEQTWTPEFDPTGDVAFSPEVGSEYYINGNGTNYIVRRLDPADAATSYEIKTELQKAANPVNVSTFLPATGIDYFRTPWSAERRYTFDTDPTSNTFMMLVFAADDPTTTGDDTGLVVESGEWGLQGYQDVNNTPADLSDDQPVIINADGTVTPVAVDSYGFPVDPAQRPTEFNWEYAADGGWGTQQFLLDSNGDYVILDDPLVFDPIQLANNAGQTKTVQLQFDGWLFGLPDLYGELARNNWQMTPEIADKVITIPEGTALTAGGVGYYIKPLETSLFLGTVTDTSITAAGGTVPDVAAGTAVDLGSVPAFTDPGMGAMPEGTVVKFSEGLPVQ